MTAYFSFKVNICIVKKNSEEEGGPGTQVWVGLGFAVVVHRGAQEKETIDT